LIYLNIKHETLVSKTSCAMHYHEDLSNLAAMIKSLKTFFAPLMGYKIQLEIFDQELTCILCSSNVGIKKSWR